MAKVKEEVMAADVPMQPEFKATMERLEALKHVSPRGVPYWFAREIMPALGYAEWRNFEGVIDRARDACAGSNIDPEKHIVATESFAIGGNGAEIVADDFILSRPAAYLVT